MFWRTLSANPLRWPSRVRPQAATGHSLDQAYARCEDITASHSRSFHFSTRFLPTDRRRAIRAFYAFCRTTDDLVDVPTIRLSSLEEWRLAARRGSGAQTDPVLLAWADTRERYGVPNRYAEELIDGCEMDLQVNRYETWEELRRYCYLVASTVGLISMRVIGMRGDDARLLDAYEPAAIDLGVALQLTNILRDVGEDLRRGRIYLPIEDLRRFNYTEDDLRAHVLDDRFRDLMRFEVARAHELYERGWTGIPAIKREGRLSVAVAAEVYRGILDDITAHDFDVFNVRARTATLDKFARLPSIVWRTATARASA
ncbi:MAG: phytoene/squalene synthase family protein [Thermoflexales bacterium]